MALAGCWAQCRLITPRLNLLRPWRLSAACLSGDPRGGSVLYLTYIRQTRLLHTLEFFHSTSACVCHAYYARIFRNPCCRRNQNVPTKCSACPRIKFKPNYIPTFGMLSSATLKSLSSQRVASVPQSSNAGFWYGILVSVFSSASPLRSHVALKRDTLS